MVSIRHNASNWRTYVAFAGLGLALVTGLPAGRGQPVSQNGNTKTSQDYSGPTNATKPPTPAKPLGVVKINQPSKKNDEIASGESAQAKSVWWNPDAWVAVFTLVLSGSTILLWVETRRLASGAEKAAIAELRPWVSVEVMAGSDLLASDNHWVITPKIIMKNHGKTPAVSTKIVVAFSSERSEVAEIQDEMVVYLTKRVNNAGKIIFPNQKAYRIDQVNDWQFRSPNPHGFKSRKPSTGNVRNIFGVVVYNFFGKETGITRFNYVVAKSVTSHHLMIGVGYGIEDHETRVPGDLLIFHPWPTGNGAQ